MTVIIGIDPGSRRTGFGVIRLEGNSQHYLDSGHLDLTAYAANERLRQIYLGIKTVVETHQPHEAAVEDIFMHENVRSAIKLGQARGAAIVALDMPVAAYSPREVKKSIVGYGAAKKDQVQFMVRRLLNIKHAIQEDAADALAIALCHAQARQMKRLADIMK